MKTAADNRTAFARSVRDRVESEIGPPLRVLSERVARAVVDGYVLRLIVEAGEVLTPGEIEERRSDAWAVVGFGLA